MYGYTREAIRVKVKKCEMNCQPEWRKFSVDPQITSVEILHSILAKAFDIRSDFSIFYRTLDPLGHETFLAVLSDWDLDAAFLRTHNYSVQTGSEPCLNLRVDVKSASDVEILDRNHATEANKLEHSSLQQSIGVGQKYVQNMQNKLPGLIMNHMEKTFSMVQRALNFAEEQIPIYPPRAALSDAEFRGFLDSVGQIIRPQELRKVIFLGGIDPSLRRVVWKHILNVYPHGMTGRERMDYIKRKATEYYKLRDIWKLAVQVGSPDSELAYVTSMVKKDVLRTDRLHPFYAGNDDNQNIASLFNILTTYALNHPKVSYCQGMSDLASPLLVTMNDEAHAYICFCAIMERLQTNFMLDGIAMTQKFSHLTEALQYYDSEFYEYLKLQQADDLLFCYRWLLLELKREFPFEDSLRMLEVQWSSLRNEPPEKELKLFDKEFVPQIELVKSAKEISQNPSITQNIQRKHRESHYANICAIRRQTSALSLISNISPNKISSPYLKDDANGKKLESFKRLNHSLDENISRVPYRRTNLMKAHQSLDETKMLLLMKNIAPCENVTESFFNFNDLSNHKILSSENQLDKNISETKINETKKIIFHSTNPFINDAQGGSTEILVCDERVEQKNFENIHTNLESALITKTENPDISEKNLINDLNKRNCSVKTESIISAQIMNKHKGHFKELKEKIAASKKGILASIDKIETHLDLNTLSNESINEEDVQQNTIFSNNSKKSQKVVKNLNEFLNFTNKSRISENTTKILKTKTFEQNGDKCIMTATNDSVDVLNNSRPIIKLTHKPTDDSCFIESNISLQTNNQDFKEDIIVELKDQNMEKIIDNSKKNILNQREESEILRSNITDLSSKIEYFNFQDSDEEVSSNIEKGNFNNINFNYNRTDQDSLDFDFNEDEIIPCANVNTVLVLRNRDKQSVTEEEEHVKRISTSSSNADVFIWENPLHQISRNSTCSLTDMELTDNKINSVLTENSLQNIVDKTSIENINPQTTSVESNFRKIIKDNNLEINNSENSKVFPTKSLGTKLETTSADTTKDLKTNALPYYQVESLPLNPFLNDFLEHELKPITNDIKELSPNNHNTQYGEKEENDSTNFVFSNNSVENIEVHQSSNTNFHAADPYSAAISAVDDEGISNKFPTNMNIKTGTFLPPPNEFGGGNPFLIFLCLTLLLQHRNIIMRNNLDYNEMAMHFDKMVRKHDVNRVLNQARRMYFEYLKTYNALATAATATDNSKINTERKS